MTIGKRVVPAILKLLNGDGIFFADPIRAMIVDNDGKLLAVSPMSTASLRRSSFPATLWPSLQQFFQEMACIRAFDLNNLFWRA